MGQILNLFNKKRISIEFSIMQNLCVKLQAPPLEDSSMEERLKKM